MIWSAGIMVPGLCPETSLLAVGKPQPPSETSKDVKNLLPNLKQARDKLINSDADFIFVKGGTIHPKKGKYSKTGLTVNSFYICKNEVTQKYFYDNFGYRPWEIYHGNYGEGPHNPAYGVTWFDIIEGCNALSAAKGLTPCYHYLDYGNDEKKWPRQWKSDNSNALNISCDFAANGYRLPSEAEWEYAARGGLQTHDYDYSGSNDATLVGVPYNAQTKPQEVGTSLPNELGLYNMSGNVWEWCWDVHTNNTRVIRGGGFENWGDYATVFFRFCENPRNGWQSIGFRLCRTAQ